ncbi:MAG: hypothetical protein QOI73_2477 [Solirubrobacteraceae bacterium]|nr:hypothetical protein [Solirubrobacteraceae bacterium]
MLELTVLALLNSLNNWGTTPVIATRTMAADAPTLHALLCDPASQERLIAGVNPLLRPHVRLSKTANPRFLHTHVQLGQRKILWITWLLTPGRGTTDVDLAAQTESRSILSRILLIVGRQKLRRHLEATLAGIGAHASHAAERLDNPATTSPTACQATARPTTSATPCRPPRRSRAPKRPARRPSPRTMNASSDSPTLRS